MVDNGIKLLLIPPGGWKYEQPVDNSAPFVIDAQTYPMLENRVLDFRLQHVEIIPSGTATRESVRDDLRAFICGRYPSQCTGPVQPTVVAETKQDTSVYLPPIRRIEDWFKKLATVQIEWKDAGRALAAAEICVNCPQNVAWETHCKGCVDAANRRILRYKGDRITPLDSRLKACRVYGHHNALSVWMTNTHSVAKEEPPAACWNKH